MEYVKAKVHFRIFMLSRASNWFTAVPDTDWSGVEITERSDLAGIRLTFKNNSLIMI